MTEQINDNNNNDNTHGLPPEVLAYLRSTHIHFCLPMYNGVCNEATFISMIKFSIIAAKLGINYSIDTMVNESLITRGRNNLVSKFLFNQAATHLMFIDADITFNWISVVKLLISGKEFTGGCYPKKCFNWDKIKHFAGKSENSNLPEEVLMAKSLDYVFNQTGITDFSIYARKGTVCVKNVIEVEKPITKYSLYGED